MLFYLTIICDKWVIESYLGSVYCVNKINIVRDKKGPKVNIYFILYYNYIETNIERSSPNEKQEESFDGSCAGICNSSKVLTLGQHKKLTNELWGTIYIWTNIYLSADTLFYQQNGFVPRKST